MSTLHRDPIAEAMWDFYEGKINACLEVTTDVSLPEEMLASYFFRAYGEMNSMEKLAMDRCSGRILDIGAGAGCHSIHLQSQGLEVTSIESSERMVKLLSSRNLKNIVHTRWQAYSPHVQFDQILLLMNGLGMAERLSQLPAMLKRISSWLSPGGEILLDSSDIGHLYELDDGSRMRDLYGSSEGEIEYTVKYKGDSIVFPWLYVTRDQLVEACTEVGLKVEILCELEESYLVSIRAL